MMKCGTSSLFQPLDSSRSSNSQHQQETNDLKKNNEKKKQRMKIYFTVLSNRLKDLLCHVFQLR